MKGFRMKNEEATKGKEPQWTIGLRMNYNDDFDDNKTTQLSGGDTTERCDTPEP